MRVPEKRWLGLVLVLGCVVGGEALAAPALTGSCPADFAVEGALFFEDLAGVDVGMPTSLGGAISGFDLRSVQIFYDPAVDRLFLGLDTYGILGDADGDGDPGGTTEALAALGGNDVPDLGGAESVALMMDLDQDGAHDVIVGVSAFGDLSDLGVYAFSGTPYAPSVSFGARLGVVVTAYAPPSAATPHLELVLEGFAAELALDGDPSFNLTAFLGSFSDAGIGEDFLPASTSAIPVILSERAGGTPDCGEGDPNGVERCDGVDQDCDGQVDEGADTDGDGLSDCFDAEACDGQDNDGDGLIDETLAARCQSPEVCDAQDNDLDGRIDEGFDRDGDGRPDCASNGTVPLETVPVFLTPTPRPWTTPEPWEDGSPIPTSTPTAWSATLPSVSPIVESPTPDTPTPVATPSRGPTPTPSATASPTALATPSQSPGEPTTAPPEGTPSETQGCPSDSLLGVYGVPGPVAALALSSGRVSPASEYAQIPLAGVTSIAVDPVSGAAFVVTGEGDDGLYRGDVGGGALVRVGSLGGGASNLQAMDFAPAAAAAHGFTPGVLYGISIDGIGDCGPNCLFALDPATGGAEALAGIAANQLRGMSFDPDTGALVAYDAGGKFLLEIDRAGGIRRRVQVASSHQDGGTGVDTLFSLAHGCDGALYGVDVAYGVLLRLDPETGEAEWVGDYGDVSEGAGSFALYGLDAGRCGCASGGVEPGTPPPGVVLYPTLGSLLWERPDR